MFAHSLAESTGFKSGIFINQCRYTVLTLLWMLSFWGFLSVPCHPCKISDLQLKIFPEETNNLTSFWEGDLIVCYREVQTS